MAANPIDGYTIDPKSITHIGKDLKRPECILAEKDGTVWSADERGGVVRIDPNGSQKFIAQRFATGGAIAGTVPNGMAIADNGDLLIANFGTNFMERMKRNGETTVMLEALDNGEWPGKLNFVVRDSKNRLWITVSTMIDDYMPASISKHVIDGRILLYEEGKGVRVVAENIHFANECRLDANEEYLYVAQTCGRNVARFRIKPNGDLGDKEIFGPTDTGAFVDGITFDAYGNLWGTHVMVDRIFALTPEGELRILLDDGRPGDIKKIDQAFQAGQITTDLLMDCGGTIARWIASITFAGDDLKTVYLGSLFGNRIAKFRSPVAGLAMAHWGEKY